MKLSTTPKVTPRYDHRAQVPCASLLLKRGARTSLVATCSSAPGKAAVRNFRLQIGQTGIQFPFDIDSARKLQTSTTALLETFAAKQKAERPKRWDIMEYSFRGDPALNQIAYFEVACNPNAYPSAFDAQVLITIKTQDGLQLTTEGKFSTFKADLDNFVQGSGA